MNDEKIYSLLKDSDRTLNVHEIGAKLHIPVPEVVKSLKSLLRTNRIQLDLNKEPSWIICE